MDLGVVLNELNENVPSMDAYRFNVGIALDTGTADSGSDEPERGTRADADQRLVPRPGADIRVTRSYHYYHDDARFVRPPPPLFIEPVLTSPDDYIHLSSLPKRAKLDEYYVRSTVPRIVRDALSRRPHNVAVTDPLNALDGGSTVLLLKSSLYGPDAPPGPASVANGRPPPDRAGTVTPPPPPPSDSVLTFSSPSHPPPPPPPLPPPPTNLHLSTTGGVDDDDTYVPTPRVANVAGGGGDLLSTTGGDEDGARSGGVTAAARSLSTREDLLASIRRGVKLRPVSASRRDEMAAVLNARRRATAGPLETVLRDRLKLMDRVVHGGGDNTDDDDDDDSVFSNSFSDQEN